MTKRAVILVPGFKKREHLSARDQLVDSIVHYGSGFRVEPAQPPNVGGMTPAAIRSHNRSDDQDVSEVHVFEVFWGDLVQDTLNESPWARFKRGLYLIWYWVAGGIVRAAVRGEFPTRTLFALMVASVLLIAWYVTVIGVLLQALGTAESGLNVQSAFFDNAIVKQVLGFVEGLKSAPLVLFIVGLAALSSVEPLANICSFVKNYLRDEPETDVDIGLRAKARARMLTMLDHVSDDAAGYDDIHVVAHSLGGMIAVDALAEYGKALPRITLHTWGSTLGLLSQQARWVDRKVEAFYAQDVTLNEWIDVVFSNDVLGSPRPLPRDRSIAQDGARRPWFPERHEERFEPTIVPPKIRRAPFAYTDTHNAYFRCEPAVSRLLARTTRPVKEQSGADVRTLSMTS